MRVYHGVVRGNAVMLPEDIDLEEGLTVEVRIPSTQVQKPDSDHPEHRFKQQLQMRGLIQEIRSHLGETEYDRTPIQVCGKPLSEVIIEERR
ncbi:MAG: hypothetical protein MAG451_00223 [Anaerolineales bacterium]|nr:hypothetical protein [Anaerolineales bacterium]